MRSHATAMPLPLNCSIRAGHSTARGSVDQIDVGDPGSPMSIIPLLMDADLARLIDQPTFDSRTFLLDLRQPIVLRVLTILAMLAQHKIIPSVPVRKRLRGATDSKPEAVMRYYCTHCGKCF